MESKFAVRPQREPDFKGPASHSKRAFRIWVTEDVVGLNDDTNDKDEYGWEYATRIQINGVFMSANEYVDHISSNPDHAHHKTLMLQIAERILLE